MSKFHPKFDWIVIVLNVVCGLFVIGLAVDLFLTGSEPGQGRSILLPFLLSLPGVYLLFKGWQEYKKPRANRPSESALPENLDIKAASPTEQEFLDPDYLRGKLAMLVKHGVLTADGIDGFEDRLNQDEYLFGADGVTSFVYAMGYDNPVAFPNLLPHMEQVEVFEDTYQHLLTRFAEMLDLPEKPTNITMDGTTLSFDLNGGHHSYNGTFPGKYLDHEVLPQVIELLESAGSGKRILLNASDMEYLYTALTPEAAKAMNADYWDDTMEPRHLFEFAR